MNNNSKTKKSLYKLLVEWLTWQKVGVFLTGISVFIAMISTFSHCHNSSDNIDNSISLIEINKNIIKNNQTLIKEELKDILSLKIDEKSQDDKMVIDLFLDIKNLIRLWEANESSPKLTDIVTNIEDIDDVTQLVNYWIHEQDKYYNLQSKISEEISDIISYGLDHDIPYNCSPKITQLPGPRTIQHETVINSINQCQKDIYALNSKINSKYKGKKIDKDNSEIESLKIQCVKHLDLLKESSDYYQFDYVFYDFVYDTVRDFASVMRQKHTTDNIE